MSALEFLKSKGLDFEHYGQMAAILDEFALLSMIDLMKESTTVEEMGVYLEEKKTAFKNQKLV